MYSWYFSVSDHYLKGKYKYWKRLEISRYPVLTDSAMCTMFIEEALATDCKRASGYKSKQNKLCHSRECNRCQPFVNQNANHQFGVHSASAYKVELLKIHYLVIVKSKIYKQYLLPMVIFTLT